MKSFTVCKQEDKDKLYGNMSTAMDDSLTVLLDRNEIIGYQLKKQVDTLLTELVISAYDDNDMRSFDEATRGDMCLIRTIRKIGLIWIGTWKAWDAFIRQSCKYPLISDKFELRTITSNEVVHKTKSPGTAIDFSAELNLNDLQPVTILARADMHDAALLMKMNDAFTIHPITMREKGDNYIFIVCTLRDFKDWCVHIAPYATELFDKHCGLHYIKTNMDYWQVSDIVMKCLD